MRSTKGNARINARHPKTSSQAAQTAPVAASNIQLALFLPSGEKYGSTNSCPAAAAPAKRIAAQMDEPSSGIASEPRDFMICQRRPTGTTISDAPKRSTTSAKGIAHQANPVTHGAT